MLDPVPCAASMRRVSATGTTEGGSNLRAFRADPADDGRPIERVLMRRLDLSRRAARRLLDTRRVFVNGRRVWIAHHVVRDGDRIETPNDAGRSEAASIPILFEDDELIVADKPAGVVTTGEDGVEGRLRRERDEPGLAAVHRLDRDTTGCLLLARTAAGLERMIGEFRAGRVHKWYRAIVIGRWPVERREIRRPIEGLTAVTRVRLVAATDLASHLEVEIETGRTHQIRRHLAGVGHPVVGDPLYGAGVIVGPGLRAVPRQMLHAERIEFADVHGRRVSVTSPLPVDFRATLRRLGLAVHRRGRA